MEETTTEEVTPVADSTLPDAEPLETETSEQAPTSETPDESAV